MSSAIPAPRRLASTLAITLTLTGVCVATFTGPAAAGPTDPNTAVAPPTDCKISRLPERKGWPMSVVTAADPTGRIIAGRGYPAESSGDYVRYPVLWRGDVMTSVPIPGVDQALNDVNSSGVAVGASFDTDTWAPLTPWVYRNGRVVALPGVAAGAANGINERGDVVGVDESGAQAPVLWPAGRWPTGPVYLQLPKDAVSGMAFDIDDDGTVVGTYRDAEYLDHAYVWHPDGSGEELAVPDGELESRAFGIRNGWAVGLVASDSSVTAVRWSVRTDTARLYPQLWIRADEANARGWLVGGGLDGRALFVSDAGDLPLPGLDSSVPPQGDLATDVSDDGRTIAGLAYDAAGDLRAVRWTCG